MASANFLPVVTKRRFYKQPETVNKMKRKLRRIGTQPPLQWKITTRRAVFSGVEIMPLSQLAWKFRLVAKQFKQASYGIYAAGSRSNWSVLKRSVKARNSCPRLLGCFNIGRCSAAKRLKLMIVIVLAISNNRQNLEIIIHWVCK